MINNYLSPTSFVVSVSRLPNVEFFAQKVLIPDITGSAIDTVAPIKTIYQYSSKLDYSDLNISFIVDENMNNYLEILNWLEGINKPLTTEQYANIQQSENGIVSDISVIVSNSHKNPNMVFTFYEAFPIALSSINLDVTSQDVNYVECTATFRYAYFTLQRYT